VDIVRISKNDAKVVSLIFPPGGEIGKRVASGAYAARLEGSSPPRAQINKRFS